MACNSEVGFRCYFYIAASIIVARLAAWRSNSTWIEEVQGFVHCNMVKEKQQKNLCETTLMQFKSLGKGHVIYAATYVSFKTVQITYVSVA